ncbi:hypothetical protein [Streptomyces sp. NPDC048442]|uniref:hypothetical protein n=1 Tax=Streptomyces sp. NPDC048442 TaxID=3154823 RepID=UPI0034148B1F
MMRTATAWPPRAGDHTSLVRAYADLLDWRLVVDDGEVSAGFENAVIHTGCAGFDAVALPRPVGNQVLIRLESGGLGPVPSLITAAQVTFLVQAGTGTVLGGPPDVVVFSGSKARLVLPPSPGVRWDTPPWSPARPEPLALLDGEQVRTAVLDALRLCNRPRGTAPPSAGAPTARSAGAGPQDSCGWRAGG